MECFFVVALFFVGIPWRRERSTSRMQVIWGNCRELTLDEFYRGNIYELTPDWGATSNWLPFVWWALPTSKFRYSSPHLHLKYSDQYGPFITRRPIPVSGSLKNQIMPVPLKVPVRHFRFHFTWIIKKQMRSSQSKQWLLFGDSVSPTMSSKSKTLRFSSCACHPITGMAAPCANRDRKYSFL